MMDNVQFMYRNVDLFITVTDCKYCEKNFKITFYYLIHSHSLSLFTL